jgi:CBS domain-containing protein
MSFEPQTAGRMMSLQFLRIHERATVAEAIARLRTADPGEETFALCAVDDDGRLIGVVPVERLVLGDPQTPLRKVASGRVVGVMPETSQDEVARIALRHRVWCIAVVDRQWRPVGMIRARDLIQSMLEMAAKKRLLRRRLPRLTRASPMNQLAPEVCYHLEASYVDSDAAHIHALLVRSVDPDKIRIASFESTKIGGTRGVRICAELIAITRNDLWIEQVAWRLRLEPGVKALNWQIVPLHEEK